MPGTSGSGSTTTGGGWGSLIPSVVSLGSKILGNKLAPDTSQQAINLERDKWNARRPFNLGQVPQVTAQTMGTSDELQRMLNGEGYNPKTLAQMRAGAIDDTAAAGLPDGSFARCGFT